MSDDRNLLFGVMAVQLKFIVLLREGGLALTVKTPAGMINVERDQAS